MKYRDWFPKFKYMESNNLVGLRSGHIIAQSPIADSLARVTFGDYKFIENGILMGLGNDGKLANFDKTKHGAVILHYDEVLNEIIDEDCRYAIEVNKDGDTYVRGVVLYVGDTFTTNNYSGTFGAATKFAKIVDGVATLQTTADADTVFAVKEATMANGDTAVELMYIKFPGASTNVQ